MPYHEATENRLDFRDTAVSRIQRICPNQDCSAYSKQYLRVLLVYYNYNGKDPITE